MEIRDLRYALAAYDTGSFARASELAFVSRQALSQGVRRLEDEIDIPLFEVADGNRLVPTPEGTIFLAQARPVVDAFDELARAYPSARDARGGTLTLSLATGAALSLPDEFFPRFSEREPGLVQEFEEGNTDNALDLLESGRADVALVGSCPSMLDPARFERALLVATGLWLAVPADNPLAGRERIRVEDLDGQRFVTAGKLNHLHRYLVGACERAGVRIEIPATSSNPDMLVQLARKHDALCFAFPARILDTQEHYGQSRIVALDAPEADAFGTYAVRRRDSRRTPAARRFWVYACEQAESGASVTHV